MAEISPISPSKNEESEQLHSQNQSISPELMEKLVHKALDWCSLHGLVVGDKHNQRSGKFPGVGIVHAPFALLPTPLARNQFLQACELTPIFNELVDRVSLDSEFLQDLLSRTKKVDAFTSRLLDIHSKMLEIGKKEDYMLDAQSKGLLQIELNTISCSFPGLSCLVSELHRTSRLDGFHKGRCDEEEDCDAGR